MKKRSRVSTSWEESGKWYNDTVGEKGHYYHQQVILPNILKLCRFPKDQPSRLLDLACGQGVLSRHLPPTVSYVGIDAASPLIAAAKKFPQPSTHEFILGDVTKKLTVPTDFSHATLILAVQNIEDPSAVFKNAYAHLQPGGLFIIVMNHPCFRIPRQSNWKVDEENKIRYRRIDRYMTPMKIPIMTHPGKGERSSQTWSYHHPLSAYSHWLKEAGFAIELIEEWCSDKFSQGGAAKMENRSREEIPLFMTLLARKSHVK